MKVKTFLSAIAMALIAAGSVAAQGNPGTVASVEFQKPKQGMTKQYEDGRKQKADWHKQQKDSQPLLVWEILTGDDTGTYLVARVGQHWADFDKPSVPDAADTEEFNKVIGNYVQSVVLRYYDYLPKISNPVPGNAAEPMAEILTFHIRGGHVGDFESAIGRVYEAAKKTNWPPHYEWYVLANGGKGAEFVLILPRDKWADFGDNPSVTPFRKMLEDAFGRFEAESIVKRIDSSVESESSSINKFRADLSYIPAK